MCNFEFPHWMSQNALLGIMKHTKYDVGIDHKQFSKLNVCVSKFSCSYFSSGRKIMTYFCHNLVTISIWWRLKSNLNLNRTVVTHEVCTQESNLMYHIFDVSLILDWYFGTLFDFALIEPIRINTFTFVYLHQNLTRKKMDFKTGIVSIKPHLMWSGLLIEFYLIWFSDPLSEFVKGLS